MAEDGAETAEEGSEGAEKPKRKIELQTLVLLLNGVLMLAALGVVVYTKMLFERPPILEHTELEKKKEEVKNAEPKARPMVSFDPITVNIAMTSGKAHYANLSFSVECRDEAICTSINSKKALFLDQMIASLGKRQITELNTVQGRLLLKAELLREFNRIMEETSSESGAVIDIYFSNLVLQ